MPMIEGIPENDATRDTANTGGIKSVVRRPGAKADEGYIYAITGILLPPTKRRNFQGKSRYFQIGEIGLSDDWELAHLWPPRFGDEAAAGIMAAPKELNQVFQNHKVEPWLQDLRVCCGPGPIEITASAASWSNKFLMSKGNPDYGKTEILKWVSYDVTNCPTGTISPAGGPLLGSSITLQLKPPMPGCLPTVFSIKADTLMNFM